MKTTNREINSAKADPKDYQRLLITVARPAMTMIALQYSSRRSHVTTKQYVFQMQIIDCERQQLGKLTHGLHLVNLQLA